MNARVWGVGWGGVGDRKRSGVIRDSHGEGAPAGFGNRNRVGPGRGCGVGTAGPAGSPAPVRRSPSAARPGSAGARRSCPRSGEGLGLPARRPAAPPPPRRPLTWLRLLSPHPHARSFLHACSPPIIHGNLTSDTIFIQHNGLIKIGSGAGGAGQGGGAGGTCWEPRTEGPQRPIALTPALSSRGGRRSVAPHLLQWCVGPLGGWRTVGRSSPLIADAFHSASGRPPKPHPRRAGRTAQPALLPARVRR